MNGVGAYHDGDVGRESFRVHDEEDDFDEAQRSFDYLSGARRQQQANVVQQLLHGGRVDGIWKTEDHPRAADASL